MFKSSIDLDSTGEEGNFGGVLAGEFTNYILASSGGSAMLSLHYSIFMQASRNVERFLLCDALEHLDVPLSFLLLCTI